MSESSSEGGLERYIGNTVRDIRQKHGLTIADVSNLAGISRGMLSKIENAQTATSLETLSRLAQALGVSLATLFSGYDDRVGSAQLVKSGEGMEVVRRGTKKGHAYHLLAYDRGPRKVFEPFLITITEESETFPSFEHPGLEFIYMLEGIVQYRHGKERYELHPGDALTFDAEIPHGPDKLIQCPIRFLTVLMYPDQIEV